MTEAIHGIINIYKEKGFTSHDVVAILRKKLRTKKVGHTGTLDPDAEGVLPICIGKATKASTYLIEKRKTYEVTFTLGFDTDTQDISGEVVKRYDYDVSKETIEEVIASFLGEYNQIPPMYSALKVNGKKLYELAREGKVIEREPRKIFIYDIRNVVIKENEITMVVECSKGTYIRTLCYDIGQVLQSGACMTELKRIQSGNFDVNTAIKIGEIDGLIETDQLAEHIVAIDTVFEQFSKVTVKAEANKYLVNGNKLIEEYINEEILWTVGEKYRVYDENNLFFGLYIVIEKNDVLQLKPEKMFL